jgi:uncharacterized protein YukE
MAAPSYTRINWIEMGHARDLLNQQSGFAAEELKKIQGLHGEAAQAWTGQSGDTWRQAVDDWIDGFNRVIYNLDSIKTTLENEIQEHEQAEQTNVGTANQIVVPNV